jgi:hypothetical protein
MRGREQLRYEHGEHNLAGELRVRPAPGLSTQSPGEERADIVLHLHQESHIARFRLPRDVRSTTPCPPTHDTTLRPRTGYRAPT